MSLVLVMMLMLMLVSMSLVTLILIGCDHSGAVGKKSPLLLSLLLPFPASSTATTSNRTLHLYRPHRNIHLHNPLPHNIYARKALDSFASVPSNFASPKTSNPLPPNVVDANVSIRIT